MYLKLIIYYIIRMNRSYFDQFFMVFYFLSTNGTSWEITTRAFAILCRYLVPILKMNMKYSCNPHNYKFLYITVNKLQIYRIC